MLSSTATSRGWWRSLAGWTTEISDPSGSLGLPMTGNGLAFRPGNSLMSEKACYWIPSGHCSNQMGGMETRTFNLPRQSRDTSCALLLLPLTGRHPSDLWRPSSCSWSFIKLIPSILKWPLIMNWFNGFRFTTGQIDLLFFLTKNSLLRNCPGHGSTLTIAPWSTASVLRLPLLTGIGDWSVDKVLPSDAVQL